VEATCTKKLLNLSPPAAIKMANLNMKLSGTNIKTTAFSHPKAKSFSHVKYIYFIKIAPRRFQDDS
jgi:hypothetical protein